VDAYFNATIVEEPFRHLFAERGFDDALYQEMLKNLPQGNEWMAHSLPNRSILPLAKEGLSRLSKGRQAFWKEVTSWLCTQDQVSAFLAKFGIKKRCALKASLVRQRPGYSLGPHTDEPSKVLTLLFYLPANDERAGAGTVIYMPKQRDLTCPGTRHHEFRDFETVKAMPFLPNSVFAFEKTSRSFHGVEPVTFDRDVLQYNINGHL